MRLDDEETGRVSAILDEADVRALGTRIGDARAWTRQRFLSLPVEREAGGARISFPDRPTALSFLDAFVPGSLVAIVRPIADAIADFAEVRERDGWIDVEIRYVGDAGSGTGMDPSDRTSEDFRTFSERAQEAGFEVEHVASDHDTIEARVRPATAPAPALPLPSLI